MAPLDGAHAAAIAVQESALRKELSKSTSALGSVARALQMGMEEEHTLARARLQLQMRQLKAAEAYRSSHKEARLRSLLQSSAHQASAPSRSSWLAAPSCRRFHPSIVKSCLLFFFITCFSVAFCARATSASLCAVLTLRCISFNSCRLLCYPSERLIEPPILS